MVPNIGCIFSIFTECIFIGIWTIAPRRKLPPSPGHGIRTIASWGKLPPPVTVGVWVRVRVSFRVGGQSDNCPREKSPPVRVRDGLGLVLGVGGQFSLAAIVLEPYSYRCSCDWSDRPFVLRTIKIKICT